MMSYSVYIESKAGTLRNTLPIILYNTMVVPFTTIQCYNSLMDAYTLLYGNL